MSSKLFFASISVGIPTVNDVRHQHYCSLDTTASADITQPQLTLGQKILKSPGQKIVKSNKSISRIIFFATFHFLQFQKWPKIYF